MRDAPPELRPDRSLLPGEGAARRRPAPVRIQERHVVALTGALAVLAALSVLIP